MDRFRAPKDAIDLCYFIKPSQVSYHSIDFNLGVNQCADGSAYIEYDSIKAICSVCGPIELKQDGQLLTSFKFAPFSSQIRRDGSYDAEEKRLSQLLLAALEPSVILDSFPRGKYHISVTILDDGTKLDNRTCNASACLSAGVTCASLALLHAGVQLYDLSIGLVINSPPLYTENPTSGGASCSLAVMPQLRQITMFNAGGLGLSSAVKIRKALEESFNWAESVYATIQDALFSMMKEELDVLEKSDK